MRALAGSWHLRLLGDRLAVKSLVNWHMVLDLLSYRSHVKAPQRKVLTILQAQVATAREHCDLRGPTSENRTCSRTTYRLRAPC